MGELLDLLALINSAINFVLYCTMSRQFRVTFAAVFFGRPLEHNAGRRPSASCYQRDKCASIAGNTACTTLSTSGQSTLLGSLATDSSRNKNRLNRLLGLKKNKKPLLNLMPPACSDTLEISMRSLSTAPSVEPLKKTLV